MAKGIPKNGLNNGWFKKGHKLSAVTRERMSRARRGVPRSEEVRRKISESHRGLKHSEATKARLRIVFKGRRHTVAARRKIGDANRGSRSHLWKGGITPINQKIRTSSEYRLWRTSVFERDNYTCIWCGAKSSKGRRVILNADHIKPFALFPELTFAIDNGRTLCRPCHEKTDTFGWNYWVNNKRS